MTVLKIWNGSEWIEISPTAADHGDLTGLQNDDHTQYSLADGTRDFSNVVGGVDPVDSDHLATKSYVDTTISGVNTINDLFGNVGLVGKGTINVTEESQDLVVSGTPHTLLATATIDIPTDIEDFTIFKTSQDITLRKMFAVVRGPTSPSVTWTVRHDAARSNTGTEVVTAGTTTTNTGAGDEITDMNSTTITGGEWVWLETTVTGGSPQELAVELFA